MHFKPIDIRGLSFRRRLFGYKAADVKDFMKHVVEDYESYQVKVSEITVYQDEIDQGKQALILEQKQVQTLTTKNTQLKEENERLRAFEVELEEIEKMKQLAQQTADTVQKEIDDLMNQAEKEKNRILEQAESTRMNHLLNAHIELGKLQQEQELLDEQMVTKRAALFELERQYNALLVEKEKAQQESNVLKQEFVSLRSKLIQKYTEGIDEFIEENHLEAHASTPTEEKATNVMTMVTKRIG